MFQLKVPDLQRLQRFKFKNARLNKLTLVLLVCVIVLGTILLVGTQVQKFFYKTSGYSSEEVDINPAAYITKPSQEQVLGIAIESKVGFMDKRAYVLDQYFRGSPLYGTGKIFVDACDKFGAPKDCTTVAAIARAETDLCRYHNSAEYHNCWGFGGGGADRIKFNSWDESINLVTERLVKTYGIKYMIDPSLMEKVFCGSEPGCTNWGNRVKFYIQEISEYSKQLGFAHSLLDLR